MLELRAVKKVKAKKILVLATINVARKRPDLVRLIGEISNSSLSVGEKENLLTYLRFLGLVDRNGRRTELGRKAEEDGTVPMPEEGLYQLMVLDDWIPIYRTNIIDFKRHDAFGELKGETFAFDDHKEIESLEYTSLNDEEFTVRFITEGSRPLAVLVGEEECSLEICAESDKVPQITISCDGRKQTIDLHADFDLRTNLSRLIEGWERGRDGRVLEGMPVPFADVAKDQRALTDGVLGKYDIGAKPLWFVDTEGEPSMDEDCWQIELRDMQVVPKDMEDAKKWVVEAFFLQTRTSPGYYKSAFGVNFTNDLIEGRGYRKAFKTLRMSKEELLRTAKEIGHNDLLREMAVADDLTPHEKFYEIARVD